jgi:hypothetical protein
VRKIRGIDEGKTHEWLEHAWALAVRFAGESGVPREDAYPAVLKEFAAAFADVDSRFETCAYELYNYKAGFLPRQVTDAADWICEGGDIGDAYSMAADGGEIRETGAPDEDESPGMSLT